MQANSAIIDVENGGFHKDAGIVEIAMIVVDENMNELKRWSRIINQYFIEGTEEICIYSEESIAIHGITPEMQKEEGVPAKQAVEEMEAIIQDFNITDFIGHSIKKFDCPRLAKFFRQFSKYHYEDPFPGQIDIHNIAKQNFQLDSYSLESLCDHFGVVNNNPHRAMGDCEATLAVSIAIDEVL